MKNRRKVASKVAVIIVFILLAGILYLTLHSKVRTNNTPGVDTVDDISVENDSGSENAAHEPTRIILPTIGVDSAVQPVGINPDREIAAPDSFDQAGWYTGLSAPGQPGLSIIDGHLDGPNGPAVFANLAQLKSGEEFVVERGDESTLTYRVLSVHEGSTTEALSLLFSQSPDVGSQLNLITCAGDFDQQTRRYDKRVVVWATLIR